MVLRAVLLSLMVSASCLQAGEPALRGFDSWGGIKSHVGVVNPVGREPADPNVLSLRGEWTFSVRPNHQWRNSSGANEWQGVERDGSPWRDTRTISVPGCWEAQGVGTSGMSRCWKVWWDSSPNPIRHQYEGDCFYRKDVVIPADWTGRRIWIAVGAINSQGWIWVNDNQVAWVQEYCATRKYDITDFVRPGESAKIVILVSNAWASRRGCFNYVNTWGGILRDVELQATPEMFIDDAWVRGDFDGQMAEVKVEVEGGRRNGSYSLRATVEGETKEIDIRFSPSPSDFTLEIPLRDFRPWSPEHPNLYWAKIELLEDGKVTMVRRERFGVRKLEVCGREFHLNGQPFFIRGAGLHNIFPVEGTMPPDRERIRRDVAIIRAAGFNQVRFHTECRWPEFFEVADEMGLLVMPELPYYSDFMTADFTFDPIGDAIDLWKTLRRHPSFAIYSGGNEGWYGPVLSKRFYEFVKKMDPDRLVFGQDAAPNPKTNGAGVSDIVGGPRTIWPNGLYEPERPFVCHEYLNVCVKLDPRLESQYTGAWAPLVTMETRRRWLERYGLSLEWGSRLQDAQHALQAHWRRYGLEYARADPHCDGYSFWSLQDVACPQTEGRGSRMEQWLGWGANLYSGRPRDPFIAYAGQALFDPFFGTKRKGESPREVAEYNSSSCVLMDDESTDWTAARAWWKKCRGNPSVMWIGGTNRVHVSGDRFPLTFLFAHYENDPVADAHLGWKFVKDDGTVLLSGEVAIGDQAVGPARKVARQVFAVPDLENACRVSLVATITGKTGQGVFEQSNHWDWWFFPRRSPRRTEKVAVADPFRPLLLPRYPGLLPMSRMEEAKTVIAVRGSDEERTALSSGKSVVSLANWDGAPNVALGRWWMGSQLGMVLSDSPLLAKLPHHGVLNPLLFRIVKKGLELPLADVTSEGYRVVGEGRDACYLYLAETELPGGARRVTVAGLDLVSDTPEGTAILDGILEGMNRCR